ncbi:hypothetical protein B0H17DRAFT_1262804 [Mycena rosella]|uniref:Uncharacterized protein n=1 Tax=Mycena rosella TaxID=1033263 RepID=A0AAD7CQ78_MYCRO|nr:hypothetical protein B0H17DRAFT_1262804 [Mycena rosella]
MAVPEGKLRPASGAAGHFNLIIRGPEIVGLRLVLSTFRTTGREMRYKNVDSTPGNDPGIFQTENGHLFAFFLVSSAASWKGHRRSGYYPSSNHKESPTSHAKSRNIPAESVVRVLQFFSFMPCAKLWKAEVEHRQSLRSPLNSAFIEYQMNQKSQDRGRAELYSDLTPSIRISTSRLCFHDLGLRSDGWPLWAISSDLIPWEMSFSITPGTRDIEQQLFARMDVCDIHSILMTFPSLRNVKLSVHHHIPFGKMAIAGGDLLDFQVHFPDSELSKVGLRVGIWRAYGAPIGADITAVDTRWTRSAGGIQNRSRIPQLQLYWRMSTRAHDRGSGISQARLNTLKQKTQQAPYQIIATGVKLNDLRLIRMVDLSMRLHYPEQNTDPPSKLPYLFVFDTAVRIEEDGTVWLDIQPPDQRHYWSFDPSGEEKLGEDLAAQLSLPRVTFQVVAYGDSWTTAQYDLLRKFHEIKGSCVQNIDRIVLFHSLEFVKTELPPFSNVGYQRPLAPQDAAWDSDGAEPAKFKLCLHPQLGRSVLIHKNFDSRTYSMRIFRTSATSRAVELPPRKAQHRITSPAHKRSQRRLSSARTADESESPIAETTPRALHFPRVLLTDLLRRASAERRPPLIPRPPHVAGRPSAVTSAHRLRVRSGHVQPHVLPELGLSGSMRTGDRTPVRAPFSAARTRSPRFAPAINIVQRAAPPRTRHPYLRAQLCAPNRAHSRPYKPPDASSARHRHRAAFLYVYPAPPLCALHEFTQTVVSLGNW